jgi:TPR repeat protein
MRDKHVTFSGGLRRALVCAAAASALALASAAPASANYEVGLAAYENGQVEVAIDIWKRFAVAGDVRSKKILGDVYSGKILEELPSAAVPLEAVRVDNVEALTWYTLAAYHDFAAYQYPTAEEVNAQILAEQRLPDIRFRMSDGDVDKAQKRVAQTFESGSPYDLYRLGDMYQRGSGVAKDNKRALQMYALAKDRGVSAASLAFDNLKPLMTKKEIETALNNAANWQPPLPPLLEGQTPQMKDLARLKKELEELRLEDALDAISDVDVELIQHALRSLGLYLGAVDNVMGSGTRQAIRKFQSTLVDSDTELTDDEKEAVRTGVLTPRQTVQLIERAADHGDARSQYVFGIMHLRGIGMVQDGEKAVTWLAKAAKQDNILANYALGIIYRDGTTGLNEVAPNKAKAAQHFQAAAARGYEPARRALEQLKFDIPDTN